MNERYLFSAEADKIQDLVFRSSKLREVSGGSQMLEEFCQNTVEKLARKFNGEVIISSGGSMRISFNNAETAIEFGEYLVELYRRKFDGTITTAGPIRIASEKDALNKIEEELRKEKYIGRVPVATEQMPYMAICGSCGVGIAKYYKKRYTDEKANYLCAVCEEKFLARERIKETFLKEFYSLVTDNSQRDFDFPQEVSELGQLEPRNYVAYLIADVNDMGVIFGSCDNFGRITQLSNDLNSVLWRALAEPTKKLLQIEIETPFIPVLPLILGGDDLFVLMPAQWALDFTRCFCERFEAYIQQALKEEISFQPTISAAVIICKAKFPYTIAHALGEELLKDAKKVAKENKISTISFRVITGNEVVKASEKDTTQTFVAGYPVYSVAEIKKLLAYRKELADLPGRRRAQLQSMFYKAEEIDYGKITKEWRPEMERLVQRMERPLSEKVIAALKDLGDPEEETYWQWFRGKYRHKLPDLLSAWDFSFDLDTNSYGEVVE
jgi:CRISPR/Cas system-associated protein Cas10 (large subunit of type III CRISPR-Cas system)